MMHSSPPHVAVYGPPGAGKSALVRHAALVGHDSWDLEDAGRTRAQRSAALSRQLPLSAPTFLGAADLRPQDLPEGTRLVLLVPSSQELTRRVRLRGDRRAHKWVQHALQVRLEHLAMADAGVFDLVLHDDGPVDHLLRRITSELAGPRQADPAQ